MMLLKLTRCAENGSYEEPEFSITEKSIHTSSPSLRNLGADTKANAKILSWLGLLTLVNTKVSPERTLLTRANWTGISAYPVAKENFRLMEDSLKNQTN